ncbi:MAG: hypothetical protein WD341_06165 [Tistlia sp.]|uniref:hypothetical protein n=1 Tax=Tistlia sp. TaxID=3057121 RepID=UPI0034A42386
MPADRDFCRACWDRIPGPLKGALCRGLAPDAPRPPATGERAQLLERARYEITRARHVARGQGSLFGGSGQ